MALPAGTRLGPYEILSPIGSGAMGDVYRGRDTRLNRDVAIKVLPTGFARDPDRRSRFEREARAVAAINHPNILAVHDIGSADVAEADRSVERAIYMITELLDGETLSARLAQGPLPLRKSIDVGIQIARGLSAAHDRGIVHRDLKPENIVLLRDGHVKILDFGLAKQSPERAAPEGQTIAGTDAGTVLGTVGYMAPEQVRGEPADPRTDLFALGVVLYELVSGRRAFARGTAAETMTAVLREDPPDLTSIQGELSAPLDRVVRHALEKDPNNRFQSARDFAFALEASKDPIGSGAAPVAAASPARSPVRGRELVAWLLAAALGLATVAVMWRPPRVAAPAGTSPVIFTAALPFNDGTLASPCVSPDGTSIAFIASDQNRSSIVVRRLDGFTGRPLKGTNGVQPGGLFWSPDGHAIGFFAGGRLKVVDLATEKLEELADAPSAYGGAWGPDGTILFSPDERSPIVRVNAKGGDVTPVTTLDATRHDEAHRWPQFMPDGRHFVFMPWSLGTTKREIQLASLDGGAPRTLTEAGSAAIVAGNHLLYVNEVPARLMAQAFDTDTLRLEGRPVPVVADDNVDFYWDSGYPSASASANTLVYSTGKYRQSRLTWYSRTGQPIGTVGLPDVYFDPAISPDGSRLAVEKRDADRGTTDLWTVDLARGAFSRLTASPGFENVATWSPDGRRIAFSSDQGPLPKLVVTAASGTGAEDVLVDRRSVPTDWSRDGRYLLYMVDGGATRFDIWAYDFERRTSVPVLQSSFNEGQGKFSPDGKWIAYVSDESQARQVFVRSFPEGATKVQVSAAGGNQPEWRRDGKEIFYLAPDSTLMAASVSETAGQIVVGASQPLFQTNAEQPQVFRNHFSVSADGQKVLVMTPVIDRSVSRLVAVLNWASALTETKRQTR